MPNTVLPVSVEISGKEYKIRSDYRAAIDVQIAQADFDISDRERALVTLYILFEDFEQIPRDDLQEALDKAMWFLACGRKNRAKQKKKQPRLVDWEQDFDLIITAVNKQAGFDIRGVEYLHWWTFMSYYVEIDSKCLFAQVVQMRDKLARHAKLEKADKKFLESNRDLIEFEKKYSEKEKEIFRRMGV